MAINLRVGENGRSWMEEREVEREVILFQLKPYIFIKKMLEGLCTCGESISLLLMLRWPTYLLWGLTALCSRAQHL